MEPTYSIAEISGKTGLSYDTIRYYEKIGLMPTIKRSKNGQREYDKEDLSRIIFVTKLKRTNMPLKEIERYMTLASAHDYESCHHILNEHKRQIESQINDMQEALSVMNFKLTHYEDLIEHHAKLRG
ncbi:MerR family transcriptional regulator [Paenibacillus sp. 5J-6]|jgi:DNA-binding transcriptional MerR regulator|uniref:MerR family transcriptional regulator n=1 Tax=Paenibacillus silvestris TaxID=2606219 RepID=A0A6L8VAS2_9BACL|nr:MerR family transcriptional regulator [Paenibacillus silvestris]MZQ86429.1 MerR family transcriptional regulator [Paenibacillus silvestris]